MEQKTEASEFKIRKFDGKSENFHEWSNDLESILTIKDLDQTLEKGFDAELPTNEDGAGSDADKKKAVRANKRAWAILKMSISCPKLRAKLKNLATADWPTPKVWKVNEFLHDEYQRVDMISKAEQKGKLMDLRPLEGGDC